MGTVCHMLTLVHPKTLGSILKQAGLRNDTGRTSEAAEGGTT
jgi:hypothetical protein